MSKPDVISYDWFVSQIKDHSHRVPNKGTLVVLGVHHQHSDLEVSQYHGELEWCDKVKVTFTPIGEEGPLPEDCMAIVRVQSETKITKESRSRYSLTTKESSRETVTYEYNIHSVGAGHVYGNPSFYDPQPFQLGVKYSLTWKKREDK